MEVKNVIMPKIGSGLEKENNAFLKTIQISPRRVACLQKNLARTYCCQADNTFNCCGAELHCTADALSPPAHASKAAQKE